jgi:hypothetical protein
MADNGAFREQVEIIVIPFTGGARLTRVSGVAEHPFLRRNFATRGIREELPDIE